VLKVNATALYLRRTKPRLVYIYCKRVDQPTWKGKIGNVSFVP